MENNLEKQHKWENIMINIALKYWRIKYICYFCIGFKKQGASSTRFCKVRKAKADIKPQEESDKHERAIYD